MNLPTPAQALWNQRAVVAECAPRLRQLIATVDRGVDLADYQWVQLFAYVLELRPDLIIELGRDYGNSTCCFLEAAALLAPGHVCRLVSLCRSDIWERRSRPTLETACLAEWFARGDIRRTDILTCDFEAIVGTARRVLLFWDAHGFEIAACVLGRVMPLLARREHVVVLHDMTDTRYNPVPRGYAGNELWTGQACEGPYMHLGHVCSRVAQCVSVVDFTTRNRVPLHSAEESLHAEIGGDPQRRGELKRLLGDLFRMSAHWFWFSLSEAPGELTFPACPPLRVEIPPSTTTIRTDPGQPGLVRRTLRALARRVGAAWPT